MMNAYSVSQINKYIRGMFLQDYVLKHLYVKGEVSNCKYHPSGHIYFSLKDETGSISCVMFAGQRKGLAFRLENGSQVTVLGNIDVYSRDGRYQLYAAEIMQDGAGQLYEKYLKLKQELAESGLFASEYKKAVPKYAFRIGVVTAPSGAAIHDIMSIARRRNPYVQLILYPALVQGNGAAESISRGIAAVSSAGVDVVIVGRGGGSLEDLWAFNEEQTARAIFACPVPVISAVGHETDTTIADFTADLRVPTPSAAAELAVFDYREFEELLKEYERRLYAAMRSVLSQSETAAIRYEKRLLTVNPQNQLRIKRQYLDSLEDDLTGYMAEMLRCRRAFLEQTEQTNRIFMINKINNTNYKYNLMIERYKGISPLKRLEQGFSYTETADGKTLTSVQQVNKGDMLRIEVTDGTVSAEVIRTKERTYGI